MGLITYMRTDAVRVAAEAQEEAREWVSRRLGREYLPDAPPVYRAKKSAQEAHEAIRPSAVAREPKALDALSQQGPARAVPADLGAVPREPDAARGLRHGGGRHRRGRRACSAPRARRSSSPGFTAVYVESREESDAVPEEEAEAVMPPLEVGEVLTLPVPRSQAALHAAAAALHRGLAGEDARGARHRAAVDLRADPLAPSRTAGYVHRERGTLFPTELGMQVNDLLVPAFPRGDGRRVHRPARGVARQDRGRRRRLGGDGRHLLQAVLARSQERGQEDGERQGRAGRRARPVPSAASRWSRSSGASAASSPARRIRSASTPRTSVAARGPPTSRPTRSARPAASRW